MMMGIYMRFIKKQFDKDRVNASERCGSAATYIRKMLQNHASERIQQVQESRSEIIVQIDYCFIKSTTFKSEKNGQNRLETFKFLRLYTVFEVLENNLSPLQIDEAAIHAFFS